MQVILMAVALAAMLVAIVVAILVQRRREEADPGSSEPRDLEASISPPAAGALAGDRGKQQRRASVASAFGGPPVWAASGPGDPARRGPQVPLDLPVRDSSAPRPPRFDPAAAPSQSLSAESPLTGSARPQPAHSQPTHSQPARSGSPRPQPAPIDSPPVGTPEGWAGQDPPAGAPLAQPSSVDPTADPASPTAEPTLEERLGEQLANAAFSAEGGVGSTAPAEPRPAAPAEQLIDDTTADADADTAGAVVVPVPHTGHESRVVHRTNLVAPVVDEVPTEWLLMTPVEALGSWPAGGMVPSREDPPPVTGDAVSAESQVPDEPQAPTGPPGHETGGSPNPFRKQP